MKAWIEKLAKDFLLRRGYWVIPANVPMLVMHHGTGTVRMFDDTSARYVVDMPAGHRLVASHYTFLTEIQE